MSTLSRIKDWNDGDILYQADLEAEFDNIITNVNANEDRNHNDIGGLNAGDYQHLLAAEYEELSNWLDSVVLGSNGLTTIPEIVLTPAAGAISNTIGGAYFSNVDKSIYVCTEE